MIDWNTVFDVAHPLPGATEEEIEDFVAALGQPLSSEEIAAVNACQNSPMVPADDPLDEEEFLTLSPELWQMPDRPLPESYLSFLRFSNGGTFRTGDRLMRMCGTRLRQVLLDRGIPQTMPGALPFAFRDGDLMYLFDMREPAIGGEYPIVCANPDVPTFDPFYSPKVADSFLEACRGTFDPERLMSGGMVLDEQNWLTCTSIEVLLSCCENLPRKLRLFSVACCRRVWHLMPDDRFRRAVMVAERFAEGEATDEELEAAWTECQAASGRPEFTEAAYAAMLAVESDASAASEIAGATGLAEEATLEGMEREMVGSRHLAVLRDIFGNPFHRREVDPAWLARNDGAVIRLAKSMYETGKFTEMPILGDALEEAGCYDAEMLEHCRGGGEHVRGCWVVNLILGKD